MSDLDHKISDTKDSLKGLIELARELQAENTRLREALKAIMREVGTSTLAHKLARAALERKE